LLRSALYRSGFAEAIAFVSAGDNATSSVLPLSATIRRWPSPAGSNFNSRRAIVCVILSCSLAMQTQLRLNRYELPAAMVRKDRNEARNTDRG
jgi:hypothetical protein